MSQKISHLFCVALEAEAKGIRKAFNLLQPVQREQGDRLYLDRNNNLGLLESGVGLVNVASSLTSVLEHYTVEHIVNVGFAGALKAMLNVGDIFICSSVAQFDYGMWEDGKVQMRYPGQSIFASTEGAAVMSVPEKSNAHPYPYASKSLVSGSSFIHCNKKKRELGEHFDLVDMEAAAIVQVANRYGVSVDIIKVVTDPLGEHAATSFKQNRFGLDKTIRDICAQYKSFL